MVINSFLLNLLKVNHPIIIIILHIFLKHAVFNIRIKFIVSNLALMRFIFLNNLKKYTIFVHYKFGA